MSKFGILRETKPEKSMAVVILFKEPLAWRPLKAAAAAAAGHRLWECKFSAAGAEEEEKKERGAKKPAV